jgi:hypothetical protein
LSLQKVFEAPGHTAGTLLRLTCRNASEAVDFIRVSTLRRVAKKA